MPLAGGDGLVVPASVGQLGGLLQQRWAEARPARGSRPAAGPGIGNILNGSGSGSMSIGMSRGRGHSGRARRDGPPAPPCGRRSSPARRPARTARAVGHVEPIRVADEEHPVLGQQAVERRPARPPAPIGSDRSGGFGRTPRHKAANRPAAPGPGCSPGGTAPSRGPPGRSRSPEIAGGSGDPVGQARRRGRRWPSTPRGGRPRAAGRRRRPRRCGIARPAARRPAA